ncbi:MAG: branched-chain amino acid ABC transporter permease [Candidatus Bipolaricaulota bacterium]
MADLFVNGIILGSIITLGAIGVTLIADILNFFNFAHGDMLSFGAYMAFFFVGVFPSWGNFPFLSFGPSMILAIILAMIVTAAFALFFDKVLFKPLRHRGASELFLALSSLGVAFIFRSIIRLVWGPQAKYFGGLQMARRYPLGITIKPDEFFIVGTALFLVIVVYLFLTRTKIGKAMRAASDNETLARITGIDTERVVNWTWIIAVSLTAAAGVLYGIQVQLRPIMGWNILIPIFVAVVVAGVGDLWGAMVGAMIIGVSQELLTGLLQDMFNSLNVDVLMTAYKPAIAFLLMIIVLLFRPQGIFGTGE